MSKRSAAYYTIEQDAHFNIKKPKIENRTTEKDIEKLVDQETNNLNNNTVKLSTGHDMEYIEDYNKCLAVEFLTPKNPIQFKLDGLCDRDRRRHMYF